MHFTQEDFKKIEQWLLANSKKDTQFVNASTPLTGEEAIVFVQRNKNVKTFINEFTKQVFLLEVPDFVNVTDKFKGKLITLEQAIRLVPHRSRKLGQIITFLDILGTWVMYQFRGEALNQWNNTALWSQELSGVVIDFGDLTTEQLDILQRNLAQIIPDGGSPGQVLTKKSTVTRDMEWRDFPVIPDEEDITSNEESQLQFKDKEYSPSSFSGYGRTYLRKNATSTYNYLSQDMVSESNMIYKVQYDYDLNEETIVLPPNCVLHFEGGSIKNGTLVLNNTLIIGTKGIFDKSLKISGQLANGAVDFDWFLNEKMEMSVYNDFINGNNPTFGQTPLITNANRTILSNLIENQYIVKFGQGIYPFDNEVQVNTTFRILGDSPNETLIFCPNSTFIHVVDGSATYPYFKDINIETWGSTLKVRSWTVNSIHGLECRNSTFISYNDHALMIDRSSSGGTGAPVYGSLFNRCVISGGKNKGGLFELLSNSNIYDDIVDGYVYFNNSALHNKGSQKALFWNSNMLEYKNSNIIYGGMDYLYYTDKLSLFYFVAHNNTFEGNSRGFKHLVYCADGNVYINMRNNRYITPNFENNYTIYSLAPNVYIQDMDYGAILYGNLFRNYSDKVLTSVSTLLDSAQTKYRIKIHSPQSSSSGAGSSALLIPNEELAISLGVNDLYSGNEADISYFEVSIPNLEKRDAFLTLPKMTSGGGVNNLISKTQEAKNCLSFGFNGVQYTLHSLLYSKVKSISSKEEYDALFASNFNNGIILVVNDIDLGGAAISLRSNVTLIFMGGSINNGTINTLTTNELVNYKGTASIVGSNRKFGTTAQRPTSSIYSGYEYFDTTLNKPLWYTGTTWVDANGATV